MAKAKTPVKTVKRPHGRPSKYTAEIAQEILDRLAKAEPLARMCRDEHLPSVMSVNRWEHADPEFSLALARARLAGEAEIEADILDIADNGALDVREDKNGNPVVNSDVVARAKLQVDTRFKLLSIWNPKRYGTQRVETEQKVSVEIKDLDQAKNEVASLLGGLGA